MAQGQTPQANSTATAQPVVQKAPQVQQAQPSATAVQKPAAAQPAQPVQTTQQVQQPVANAQAVQQSTSLVETGKRIFKKWWFWVIVGVIVLGLISLIILL